MKPRDLAILAGVGVVAAFAVGDAIRARGHEAAERPREAGEVADATLAIRPGAPLEPGALSGRLVVTDEECAVRVVDLTRVRVSLVERDASCGLWGPRRGDRFAYGVESDRVGDRPSRSVAFRIQELEKANRDRTLHHGVPASIRWDDGGRRVAWCDHYGTPFELDLDDGTRRRLPSCPVGYAPGGVRAEVAGERVVARGRTVAVTRERPLLASFGSDGTVGVVTARAIAVYEKRGRVRATVRRPRSRGAPILAPDNCAALVRSPHDVGAPQITILPLGCRGVRARALVGSDAAWSPDARWIAVADDGGITFHPFARRGERLRLAIRAQNLLWLEAA